MPLKGTFFREQVLALNERGVRADVVYLETRSLRTLSMRKVWRNYFQVTSNHEAGIFIMRQKGWNTNIASAAGGQLYVHLSSRLVKRYIEKQGCPDLIHAHNFLRAGCVADHVKRKFGIPYVVTEHSSDFLSGSVPQHSLPHIREAYQNADKVVAVSEGLALKVKELLGEKTVAVIPNMVDTDFFSLRPNTPQPDKFVFLAIASLDTNKGLDILIRAFAKGFSGCAETYLNIAGEGPQSGYLRELAKTLGVHNQVRFLGHLSREEVRSALWSANVLVLASLHETFGVVLIEALSTGLPVIATRSGGPESIVTPEVGMLVGAGDAEELCSAMQRMRQEVFSNFVTRNYALNLFSRTVVTKLLIDTYREVFGKTV